MNTNKNETVIWGSDLHISDQRHSAFKNIFTFNQKLNSKLIKESLFGFIFDFNEPTLMRWSL